MQRFQQILRSFVLSGVCGVIAVPAMATQTQPDNTKVNTRDQAKGAVTADQQKNNAHDLEITRKIRQSLVKDKALSRYAHNVKIITQDGHVTLKGPVRSEEEKRTIETRAVDVAGAGNVTNQMSVAPPSSPSSKG
jgi:hyperosmotically inducible protein